MKRILKFLGSRTFLTGALILLQVVWLAVWFLRLTAYAHWVNIFFAVISVLICLYIVNKNENPAYKIAWILLIAIVPALGSLMYLLVGNKRPSRKLRRRLEAEQEKQRSLHVQGNAILEQIRRMDQRVYSIFRYIWERGSYPAWSNTRTDYYPVGEEMFQAMLADLKRAEHYIV